MSTKSKHKKVPDIFRNHTSLQVQFLSITDTVLLFQFNRSLFKFKVLRGGLITGIRKLNYLYNFFLKSS